MDENNPELISQREQRREQKLRKLGTRTPHCACCIETDPASLASVLVCAACQLQADGKKPTEAHHLAGRHNDKTTALIPANDHRILSDAQLDWPERTMRNPEGSPLLRAAASIRGWLDVMQLMITRTIGWIPVFLEWLDAKLTSAHGKQWWIELGWTGPNR